MESNITRSCEERNGTQPSNIMNKEKKLRGIIAIVVIFVH